MFDDLAAMAAGFAAGKGVVTATFVASRVNASVLRVTVVVFGLVAATVLWVRR
jgi:hypothetical protein